MFGVQGAWNPSHLTGLIIIIYNLRVVFCLGCSDSHLPSC